VARGKGVRRDPVVGATETVRVASTIPKFLIKMDRS
jgi:hypothetical protein